MYNYSNLSFTELVNKIGSSRFFHLPKMLEEILGRLSGSIFSDAPSDGEQYARQDGEWAVIEAGGGKYYIKAGAGWVYQQILAVV